MSAASNTSNATECIGLLDHTLFDLGCLGPALAIILIMASFKSRTKYKLEYCEGHPGLLIPINFLGGLHNRYTIAATFGATASTCLAIFLDGKDGIFVLPGPAWVKVFQGIITVLVYGILFYPFFACLTTDYKLVGSFLGFLYGAVRFSLILVIDFQCRNEFSDTTATKFAYLQLIAPLPTYLCFLFIVTRFAVLLFLEVRKKWFQSSRERTESESSQCCLLTKPDIIHVNQLLAGRALNPELIEERWYTRLRYFIYKPRPDFKFSTPLMSTLFVGAIAVFQLTVVYLVLSEALRVVCKRRLCEKPQDCEEFCGVIFGGIEGGLIVAAVFSVLLILHFMKCHRDHVLQLYRGQVNFAQSVEVSPATLVGRSLRYCGYQIAYIITGNIIFGFFLAVFSLLLAFIFKYAKEIFPNFGQTLEDAWEALLPTVGMAVFLLLFQLFLAYFVFRDKDFPNITVTIDNRRLYSIMSYFFFFYNILLGLFSCIIRILKGMVLGVIFTSRIDRTALMHGFQRWDNAFVAYLGFLHVLVAHRHPVLLAFCQLLIDRNNKHLLEESLEERPPNHSNQRRYTGEPGSSVERSSLLVGSASTYDACPRELRHPRMSRLAVNRWLVAVTLIKNPSLVKYRHVRRTRPLVRIGREDTDTTLLV